MVTMGHRTDSDADKLTELMSARRPVVRQADLARDMGITGTSMARYFKQLETGTINEEVWAQLARLLQTKYGIDATAVRPLRTALSVDTTLVPYLDAFSDAKQLEALIAILESNEKRATDLLLVLARDRLSAKR
jgi:transcriptional regulator with XRE-family HTH domain